MATLKDRFEEIIHMTWSEFTELEKSGDTLVDDGVLCALVRICADTDDIAAAKLAFDRIDGLLETPLEVKVPKFYTRFVNAKELESGAEAPQAALDTPKEETSAYDPATAKLRETLAEMRRMPKAVVILVLKNKKLIDESKPTKNDPMVKSIIVANLLKNVSKGRFRAIELVFDQIDGKLTRTVTLLGGEDVYIDDYLVTKAPADALKDKDGYYIAENQAMTTIWLRGFANSQKGLEMLAEGLDD